MKFYILILFTCILLVSCGKSAAPEAVLDGEPRDIPEITSGANF